MIAVQQGDWAHYFAGAWVVLVLICMYLKNTSTTPKYKNTTAWNNIYGEGGDEKDEKGKEERMSGQDAEDYGFEVENGGDGE